MRRRLDLGATLVGAPRVLLLDEPTTGLDPASRIGLWEAVRELVADGTDVVLTTQYLDEADHLADRIVIIDHGRTIAEGSPAELKAAGRPRRHRGPSPRARPGRRRRPTSSAPRSAPPATHRRTTPAASRSPSTTAPAASPRPCAASTTPGIVVDDLALRRPTLDEIFLALTGHDTDRERTRRHDRAPTP